MFNDLKNIINNVLTTVRYLNVTCYNLNISIMISFSLTLNVSNIDKKKPTIIAIKEKKREKNGKFSK